MLKVVEVFLLLLLTVLTLQSLNAKLQRDLREEESKQKRLVDSNMEFKTAIDNMKQKHQDLMKVLEQKVCFG